MSNRVDVASNSTSSSPTAIGTTTKYVNSILNRKIICFFSDRTMRRKNKWICLAVIGSIITITAIVVPITIIRTSEDNKIATNTTIKTGAKETTLPTTKGTTAKTTKKSNNASMVSSASLRRLIEKNSIKNVFKDCHISITYFAVASVVSSSFYTSLH
jgi:ABC-type siderophore export system fused ATPase/permease subunit